MRKPNRSLKLAATIAILSMTAACTPLRQIGTTATFEGLQSLAYASRSSSFANDNKKRNLRILAIKETALSIAAQSGLAYRAKQIDAYLVSHNRILDKIYDFDALMLDNNVLPPVLLEGRNTLNLATPSTIRVSERTYKIAKQARFVTTAPNWRQYIWMDYKIPDRPNSTLLPKTSAERNAWLKYTYNGWQKGVEQAETIFADSLARLKEDYSGMIRYRKLLALNMVSPPYVSHTEMGVTGDGNEIHIDDRVLRITALPALKPNSHEWQAAISKAKDKLKNLRRLERLAKQTKIEITDQAWQPVIPKAE